MASKSGARTSPDKLRKVIGNQALGARSHKSSPLKIIKTSKSEPVTPRELPKAARQVATKQVLSETKEDKSSLHTHQTKRVNSLADQVDTSLSLGNKKQVPSDAGPELSETTKQESKASEHGVSPGLAKVSDGLAKTSGSAKTRDPAD
jgi:hypothetical protein